MKNEMFIEYDSQVVKFPVNPEKIELCRDSNNETTEIVSLGEINMLKESKLATLEFDCFFPPNKDPAYVLTKGDFKSPSFYIDFLEKIRNAKKSCRFIVSGTKINMLCSIESFSYGIQAGPIGEIYYSLSLKEYRAFSVKEVKVNDYGSYRPKTKNINTGATVAKPATVSTPAKPVKKTPYAGCTVRVNGQLHRDSYGAGPGQWRRNYTGKINFLKPGRKCPYHVTTPSGGWLGWVVASAVEVIS